MVSRSPRPKWPLLLLISLAPLKKVGARSRLFSLFERKRERVFPTVARRTSTSPSPPTSHGTYTPNPPSASPLTSDLDVFLSFLNSRALRRKGLLSAHKWWWVLRTPTTASPFHPTIDHQQLVRATTRTTFAHAPTLSRLPGAHSCRRRCLCVRPHPPSSFSAARQQAAPDVAKPSSTLLASTDTTSKRTLKEVRPRRTRSLKS